MGLVRTIGVNQYSLKGEMVQGIGGQVFVKMEVKSIDINFISRIRS